MNKNNGFIVLILVLLLSACATKQVAVQARFPAGYPEAAQLQKISVLDFQGTDGASFANQLTAELKAADLDGQLLFSVISQDVIKAGSSIRSTTGAKNLSAAMKYGRRLGVQGIYYGDVSPMTMNTRSWQEDRTKCLEYKSFMKCKKEQKYKVNCYEQSASYSAQPKLVNIKTGSVVYTESVSSAVANKYCTDKGRQFSREELAAYLRAEVAKKVRRKVAPYNDVFNVQLKDDAKGLSAVAEEKFEGGLAFSEAGQMDRACAIWQELSATVPASNKNISLLYNLGVCAEVVADYDRALELYSKADSMLTAPDKVISGARERALKLKANQSSI